MNNHHTAIIIGGGSAGCATAIQLKRSNIDFLLFEKDEIGGLARNANLIENYLGFPQGITGKRFIALLKKHLQHLEIVPEKDEIIHVEYNQREQLFSLTGLRGEKYSCNYLVLATGTIPRKLNIQGEEEIYKDGLLCYEPISLPTKLKNKKIIIVGGGDAAFDYALNLSEKARKVTILHRNEGFKALKLLQNRVCKKENILIQTNVKVYALKVIKDGNKEQNVVELEQNNAKKIFADYVLVAIGRKPNDALLKRSKTKKLVDHNFCFIIGDVKNKEYRQISIASGQGIKCAMKIVQLEQERKKELV